MSYSGEVMRDGPAAYWRLGETAGAVAADASANGRHGAWSGSPVIGQTGALDSDADFCALFDGADDRIDLPALPSTGTTFTIELWFRPLSGGDSTQCVFGEAGGGISVFFKPSSQKLSAFYSSADHLNDTPLAFDTWHHVCIVVDAGVGVFYIDGVADGGFAAFPSGFAPDRIGDDTAGNTYSGYLDEVALYAGVALDAGRVAAHYAAAWRGLLGLRPRLRRELHDEEAASYRWTDGELDAHVLRAAAELSRVMPDERLATLTATPGSRDLSIASLDQLVRVEAVEFPVGSWPPEYAGFQTWGSTLTLLTESPPAGADDVRVYWGRRHQVERLTSTVPARAEEALLLGASAFALLELANFAINRLNLSPLAQDEYRRQGEERLARFEAELRQLGDGARVRVSRLYTRAGTPAAGSSVTWES
jgi:hypothetical protein